MENRFQEALDLIKPNSKLDYDYLDECSDKEEILKAYDTLQELISDYTELVNEKCMKCGDFQIITRIDPPTILCKEKGCKWYGK